MIDREPLYAQVSKVTEKLKTLDIMCKSYGCSALKLIEKCVAADNQIAELHGQVESLSGQIEELRKDAERYRWLHQYLVVAADDPEDWTCWLALQCIPFRSKESDAQALLDTLIVRFPLDAAKESGNE
jgi:hypothetical protein